MILFFLFQATLAAVRSQLEEWKAKARDLQTELEDMRTKFHDLQASVAFVVVAVVVDDLAVHSRSVIQSPRWFMVLFGQK